VTFNSILFVLCGYVKDTVVDDDDDDDDDALPATFPELVERIWSAAIGAPAMLTELEYCYMCRCTYDDLTEYRMSRSQNVGHKMCQNVFSFSVPHTS